MIVKVTLYLLDASLCKKCFERCLFMHSLLLLTALMTAVLFIFFCFRLLYCVYFSSIFQLLPIAWRLFAFLCPSSIAFMVFDSNYLTLPLQYYIWLTNLLKNTKLIAVNSSKFAWFFRPWHNTYSKTSHSNCRSI